MTREGHDFMTVMFSFPGGGVIRSLRTAKIAGIR